MGKVRKYVAVGLSLITIAGSAIAIVKRRDITDWYILRNYEPSSEIEALAERTTLSPLGQKLFYVYDPQLLSKEDFNSQCTFTEQSIVLGCYDGVGIYLYDITDPQLEGVEEVTSAHEMLHAAYARLSSKDKQMVDNYTAQVIENSTSERIKKLVENYRLHEPSSVKNEIHSIVATEIRDIPVELEEYYARYFLNRLAVVEFSEKYETVFISLDAEVEKIDTDLLLRKSEIDNLEANLETQAGELQAWETRLSAYRANNQYAQYNSEVGDFNASVADYNAKLQKARRLTAEYNQKVIERNNLALKQNQLVKSLDSKAEEL